ncbi:hypothetical protein AB1Y20_014748 [Prymnesium parvum]|uniref:Uncharacterized protein n=1 Tax=Prymnesium parvum TaxID=97485 RepID=A0AB34ICZ7_PRYPA
MPMRIARSENGAVDWFDEEMGFEEDERGPAGEAAETIIQGTRIADSAAGDATDRGTPRRSSAECNAVQSNNSDEVRQLREKVERLTSELRSREETLRQMLTAKETSQNASTQEIRDDVRRVLHLLEGRRDSLAYHPFEA